MALRGPQWNLTHYTYTCSSGGLESDTLHLYLQGPKGCTQSSGIVHLALSNTICSCFSPAGLEDTEKTIRKCFTFCLQRFMTPETCVGFLSREFVSISASSCFCSEVIILGELFFCLFETTLFVRYI